MSLTIDPADVIAGPALPIQPIGDEVIVWSKPSCVQCNATYRKLDEKGIEYQTLDLTEHPEALTAARAMNHLQAPVVQHGTQVWSGFRPDKIDEIALAAA